MADASRMRYNGLAPNRAHDVLCYLRLVDGTGDPSASLLNEVRAAIRSIEQGEPTGYRGELRRFDRVSYDSVARRVGWHRGGPGDHLAKALAVLDA